jgi:hypothetical protein
VIHHGLDWIQITFSTHKKKKKTSGNSLFTVKQKKIINQEDNTYIYIYNKIN